jgi:NADH-quinone oxidoreductase subunit H
MRLTWLLPLFVLVSLLGGCRSAEPPPSLLEVFGISPTEVELGDRLELVGNGFPEGKPATLTFRGDLHRPGRQPQRSVAIVAPATATSHSRISLVLSEQLQASFCGRGAEAEHTTFRGEVLAAFAPRKSGAPPVTGLLDGVVLDFLAAPATPERAAERSDEGKRALEHIGVRLTDGAGLVIGEVVKGSRAERAGLLPGDVLLELDGVLLREVADLVPSGAERYARVLVRRGKLKEPVERLVDVQGFRAVAPAELAVAGALISLLAAILLLGALPLSRVLTWLERCTVARIGGFSARRPRARWLAPLAIAAEIVGRDPMPRRGAWMVLRVVPPLLFLAVSAASTAIAMGQHLISPDLDLPVMLAASLTAQVTTGLMLGGWRECGRWSLIAGLKRALAVLACQIPAIAGFACVVMSAGTLRVREIVEAQGAAPWGFNAFKNPVLLIALLLVIVAAVPETSRAASEEHPATRSLAFFAEWGNALIASALCAALFLGGWRLPGVSSSEQSATLALSVIGALLLQLKCWTLVLIVSWVRWLLPRVRLEQLTAVLLRWLLPSSLAVLGLGAAWLAGLRSPVLRGLEGLLGYVLFGLVAFVLGKLVVRVWAGLRPSSSVGGVNPWI